MDARSGPEAIALVKEKEFAVILLDVSRIAAGKLTMKSEVIDFTQIVEEVLDRFKDQMAELKIPVRFEKEHKHLSIQGDRFRIEQVITNLITNAIKYGEGREIRVQLDHTRDRLHFSVTDDGLGIAEENLDRIFNRYERAIPASNISGLGLGLYISKQIVQAHKGTITVASKVGKGSSFIIELPLLEQQTQVPRQL